MLSTLRRCKISELPLPSRLQERLGRFVSGASGQVLILEGETDDMRARTAEILAAALLCHESEDGACGHCPSCVYLEAGTHADLVQLPQDPDVKRIPVEEVRSKVMGDSYMAPQLGARKLYLIDGEKLNEQGQNALLKTLEEPPRTAYFILTVQKREALLGTLRSRAVVVTLASDGSEESSESSEKIDEEARQTIAQMVLTVPKRSFADLLMDQMKVLEAYKNEPEIFYQVSVEVLRDLSVMVAGAEHVLARQEWHKAYQQYLQQYRPDAVQLRHQIQQLETWFHRLRGNANFDMTCSALLLAWRKEYPYG